ncbi:hypothetical protein F3J23_08210 [Chryseobacterium sp. Tr-659]|nr:LuxR C-terminal-related transcriptional regulator [Chryseobacterium sp. Tr-659]NIF05425.1 hypothetical protein [Chryseobacterium sp. Tr-659]
MLLFQNGHVCHEISAIENTSPGTIRAYKTKIKNKLNVSEVQN